MMALNISFLVSCSMVLDIPLDDAIYEHGLYFFFLTSMQIYHIWIKKPKRDFRLKLGKNFIFDFFVRGKIFKFWKKISNCKNKFQTSQFHPKWCSLSQNRHTLPIVSKKVPQKPNSSDSIDFSRSMHLWETNVISKWSSWSGPSFTSIYGSEKYSVL